MTVSRNRRFKWMLIPMIFLAPALMLYAVFFLYPLAYTVFLSFHQWDMINPDKDFVGWDNYYSLFKDEVLWKALVNTFLYMLMTIPISMTLGFLLALFIESLQRGKSFYRFIFYLPVVSSIAVVSIVWMLMYDQHHGIINQLFGVFGIKGPNWLADSSTALWAIAIVGIWKSLGSEMLLYISGLKSIDKSLYEAASIDGASRTHKLIHITLPLLSPITLFLLVMGMISSFQNFALVKIMTGGGPNNSTNVLVYQIYQEAFGFFNIGRAAAISLLLFLIVLTITVVQLKISKKTVHYG
ncbi:sugar ABC transporter permease [Paenibacillus pectinilyticus]|uniref:Sugar ABC transporter permease n=1 Tax=Paenibacillus pectinilyticus TaxID=512399 RepID=A0A1C1A762_9BACL|nr:sugar ABC transporter permease [Paenibacillus pectinilyticus]OCT16409.1 sugar ABC transporter permease [Paenibacillus pectinilyticus]